MAMVAAGATREEKEAWVWRPLNWAWSVSFFAAVFGFVYYYFAAFDPGVVIVGLIMANVATAGMLLWAIRRIDFAMRGY